MPCSPKKLDSTWSSSPSISILGSTMSRHLALPFRQSEPWLLRRRAWNSRRASRLPSSAITRRWLPRPRPPSTGFLGAVSRSGSEPVRTSTRGPLAIASPNTPSEMLGWPNRSKSCDAYSTEKSSLSTVRTTQPIERSSTHHPWERSQFSWPPEGPSQRHSLDNLPKALSLPSKTLRTRSRGSSTRCGKLPKRRETLNRRFLATRWSLFAANEEEAWESLYSWRGLRAPGRLEAVDPQTLRERADELPRDEVLGRYSLVNSPEEIVEVYRPLVETVRADIVTFQMASLDQPALIELLGAEVLPQLRG